MIMVNFYLHSATQNVQFSKPRIEKLGKMTMLIFQIVSSKYAELQNQIDNRCKLGTIEMILPDSIHVYGNILFEWLLYLAILRRFIKCTHAVKRLWGRQCVGQLCTMGTILSELELGIYYETLFQTLDNTSHKIEKVPRNLELKTLYK